MKINRNCEIKFLYGLIFFKKLILIAHSMWVFLKNEKLIYKKTFILFINYIIYNINNINYFVS